MPISWKDWDISEYYGDEHKPRVLPWLWENLKIGVLSLICKVKGHDIEMEGYAGPNSGYECWECKRCGISDTIYYY